MTMRSLLVVAFLTALSGCNYLLPPGLLPVQDQDADYEYRDFYECVMHEELCYRSTRANLVYTDTLTTVELNSAILNEVYFVSR